MKNKKIKVAYLDQSKVFSGAENSLLYLIENLDLNKYEPIITYIYPQEHQKRYGNICKEIYLNNAIKWWMGSDAWKKPIRGTDFLKRIILGFKLASLAKKEHIDIVHINLLEPKSYWFVFLLNLFRIKIVGHSRSEPLQWIPNSNIQNKMASIITVSDFIKEKVLFKFEHKYVFTIYDPVDALKYKDIVSKEELYKKLNITENKKIISSVGLLAPHKNHEMAIKVFAKLTKKFNDLTLLIAGGGSQERISILKNLAKEFGVLNDVIFTEKQIDFIDSVYTHSEFIFSLTLPGEAFGRVPFEALFCKTPTIGPTRGAILELIDDMKTGFIADPESLDDVYAKADFILSNKEETKKIVEAGYEYFKELLAPKTSAKKVMKLYESILKND